MRKLLQSKLFLLLIGGATVATVCAGTYFYNVNSAENLNKQLDLGQKYIDEMDWEQAIAALKKAIEIDPKNVEAYLKLAEVYSILEDYELAFNILQLGYENTGDERLEEYRRTLEKYLEEVEESSEEEISVIESESDIENTTQDSETEENTEVVEETSETEAGTEGDGAGDGNGDEDGTEEGTDEAKEEEKPQATGFIITEEEFTYGVMFRPSMELMPIEDDYSVALVAAIEAKMESYGREKQFKDGMLGRSYPIRFGEDVNVAADNIVMDIEAFFFDGGNCYDIHHVKKADNGYIVSYSVE